MVLNIIPSIKQGLDNYLINLSKRIAIRESYRTLEGMMPEVGREALKLCPGDRLALKLATRIPSISIKDALYDLVKQYIPEEIFKQGRELANEQLHTPPSIKYRK